MSKPNKLPVHNVVGVIKSFRPNLNKGKFPTYKQVSKISNRHKYLNIGVEDPIDFNSYPFRLEMAGARSLAHVLDAKRQTRWRVGMKVKLQYSKTAAGVYLIKGGRPAVKKRKKHISSSEASQKASLAKTSASKASSESVAFQSKSNIKDSIAEQKATMMASASYAEQVGHKTSTEISNEFQSFNDSVNSIEGNSAEANSAKSAEIYASQSISNYMSQSASLEASYSYAQSQRTSYSNSVRSSMQSAIEKSQEASSQLASESASISASVSQSAYLSTSASFSASASQSASTSVSISMSVSTMASLSNSASIATSASLSASQSASFSVSASVSANQSASISLSASQSASLSMSASVSTSASLSASASNAVIKSKENSVKTSIADSKANIAKSASTAKASYAQSVADSRASSASLSASASQASVAAIQAKQKRSLEISMKELKKAEAIAKANPEVDITSTIKLFLHSKKFHHYDKYTKNIMQAYEKLLNKRSLSPSQSQSQLHHIYQLEGWTKFFKRNSRTTTQKINHDLDMNLTNEGITYPLGFNNIPSIMQIQLMAKGKVNISKPRQRQIEQARKKLKITNPVAKTKEIPSSTSKSSVSSVNNSKSSSVKEGSYKAINNSKSPSASTSDSFNYQAFMDEDEAIIKPDASNHESDEDLSKFDYTKSNNTSSSNSSKSKK